ncbi:CLUMA_CG012526, isoform A [Clunio marinus]|uniref:CLUMA_CG012526, isoform A n=1 Tax=Clunio marinus TaxID=568069 RepID=A0A1J1IG14_9DIPT|nr:CLUMA_CG012526, isoform A [Clunio marinus]
MIHKTYTKSFECQSRDHHQQQFEMILKTASLTKVCINCNRPQKTDAQRKERKKRKMLEIKEKNLEKYFGSKTKKLADWFRHYSCFLKKEKLKI